MGTILTRRSPAHSYKPRMGSRFDPTHWQVRGLAGWWPFWEGAGGTVYDISGNGHHGTLTNMDPATDWVPGRTGHALDFDGTDDYVNVPSVSSIRTVSLWVKIDSHKNFGRFYDWRETKNGISIFGRANGQIDARYGGTSSAFATSSASEGEWNHWVVTFDGSTAKLYKDGNLEGSGSETTDDSEGDFVLGVRGSKDDQFLDGQIDDVRIYDRALSADEVRQLYLNPWAPFEESAFRRFVGTTAATTVNHAPAMPAGWLADARTAQSSPASWLATVRATRTLSAGWTASLSAQRTIVTAWGRNVFRSPAAAVSWLQTTLGSRPIPVSWQGSAAVAGARTVPLDWTASLNAARTTKTFWGRNLSHAPDVEVAWLGAAPGSRSIPVSWATSVTADRRVIAEWLAGRSAGRTLPADWMAGLSASGIVPVAWGGASATPDAVWLLDSRSNVWLLESRATVWLLGSRPTVWDLPCD